MDIKEPFLIEWRLLADRREREQITIVCALMIGKHRAA